MTNEQKKENSPLQDGLGLSRRSFMRHSVAAVGGVTATGAALWPVLNKEVWDDLPSMEEFLQKHYKELSPEEMEKVLARISAGIEAKWGVEPNLRDVKPQEGVEFVYALNLSRCIGCRKCVYACVEENNQSRSPQIQYIRVLEMPRGTMDVEQGVHDYDPPTVPRDDRFYMPIQCHQCLDAPCIKVCPIEATWTEDDGITVVDYDWCIGCRYCEAACPYWARRFNFTKPDIEAEELNPEMAYLSNRPRSKGSMEKCTFCLHRTREGKLPACLEVCPMGARKFGDVEDPKSEVSEILRNKRVFVLKEDVGTSPRFFYYFDERNPRAAKPVVETDEPAGDTSEESAEEGH
jgi:Fe-S-cluster-containing dehydrogenase component